MAVTSTKPASPLDPVEGIHFDGVSKWFRSKGSMVHALSRVTLDITDGEFVSVIGPSGCGKSTLLRLAGGLLEPERGTITIRGEAPDQVRQRKRYAFVPQQPALLPWRTVRKNVALLGELNRGQGTSISAEEQLVLLEHIGLGPFVDAYPSELSGGMQQRVNVARAFALGASVMLMDEPFSALDEMTRADMRYLLLDLWRQAECTVVFVTHSVPEAVALSDRVVVLGPRPGRITRIIDVDLPRPRRDDHENSHAFHGVVATVRAALNECVEQG